MPIMKKYSYLKCGLLVGLLVASVNIFAFDLNEKRKEVNFITVELPVCNDNSEDSLTLPEDPRAELYYQAALKIFGQNDVDHYPQMYILTNKAAEMGHWRAKLMAARLYLKHSDSEYTDYQPEKAKAYMVEMLQQNIPAAYYAMGQFKSNGVEVFRSIPIPASVFLFEAAKLNYPDALSDVHDVLMSVGRSKEASAMLDCAVSKKQDNAEALFKKSNELETNATKESEIIDSFKYLYQAIKAGSYNALASIANKESYYKQQYDKDYFSKEFLERMTVLQKAKNSIYINRDVYRKSLGKPEEVRGNSVLVFSNLEKIAPLPPENLPNWNGDIALAMSEKGAVNYRTDYDYDQLVKEAEAIVVNKEQTTEPAKNTSK